MPSGPENDSISVTCAPGSTITSERGYIAAAASPENTCAIWIGLADAAPRLTRSATPPLMKAVLSQ